MRRIDEAPALDEPWTLGDLRAHWSARVGPMLASVSKPIRVHGEQLLIGVATEGWRAELAALSGDLMADLPMSVDGQRLMDVDVVLHSCHR